MSHPILSDAQAKMKKAVDYTLHEFSAIHTGKATPAMVETVMVEAYGSHMPLKQCAAISTPDARLIQIQPWDAGLVKAITKSIIDAKGFLTGLQLDARDGKIAAAVLKEILARLDFLVAVGLQYLTLDRSAEPSRPAPKSPLVR